MKGATTLTLPPTEPVSVDRGLTTTTTSNQILFPTPPHVNFDDLDGTRKITDFLSAFTVDTLVRFVKAKLGVSD